MTYGRILSVLFLSTMSSVAAIRYVDNSVASSGNGQSWTTAWKNLSNITGLSAGDTVYISGGTTSQTYSLTSAWTPAGGVSGNPITYAVGQDAGHHGIVIFDGASTAGWWVSPSSWVTLNGDYQGSRHFQLQRFTTSAELVVFQGKHGLVVKYVTFQVGDAVNLNYSDHYEIAFCTMESNYDHAISANAPPAPTGYDENLIHDNTILLDQKNDGSGWGSDGVQNGSGISYYNNVVRGITVAAYPSGQHQDGIQTDGQYTKVYNNIFIDIGNYAVFFELFGNANNMQVFNNVIYMSDQRYAGGGQQGIAIGRSGGASGTITFSNVVVANNTIANYGGVAVAMSPGPNSIWNSTDMLYNNVGYATAGFSVDGNVAGVNSASNKSVNSGGANIFHSYQAPSSTAFAYDFHLKSTDTVLKGQGVTTVASIFNTDKDGVARPVGGPWDIGAYQATSGGGPTLPTAPTALVVVVH
jgi:hypothetical protein